MATIKNTTTEALMDVRASVSVSQLVDIAVSHRNLVLRSYSVTVTRKSLDGSVPNVMKKTTKLWSPIALAVY